MAMKGNDISTLYYSQNNLDNTFKQVSEEIMRRTNKDISHNSAYRTTFNKMAEIINIQSVSPNNFEFQEYSSSDLNLITSTEVETSFNPSTDYIEYYIYDLSGNILVSNIYGFPQYKLINNQVSIEPVGNLISYGYEQGSYNTLYNFLKRKLGSNPFITYYIDEISSDRTEIRLNTTEIPNIDVVTLTNDFIDPHSSLLQDITVSGPEETV